MIYRWLAACVITASLLTGCARVAGAPLQPHTHHPGDRRGDRRDPGRRVSQRYGPAGLKDPPPEPLLEAPLAQDLPLYPGAYIQSNDGKTMVLLAKGAEISTVRAWYAEKLPEYGWRQTGAPDTYETAAWARVKLDLAAKDGGILITFTRRQRLAWLKGGLEQRIHFLCFVKFG